MAFLNAARPLINDKDALVIRISGSPDRSICVVIEPRVTLPDPETADPELAALQAALAMPLVLRVTDPNSDLDQTVRSALEGMRTARAGAVTAIAAYEEAQAEARNQAKLAAAKKNTKKPVPTTAAVATPDADSGSEVEAGSAVATASAPAAASSQGCIFD
jgi:hypothetical protein